jgi:hypothetical protein
MKPFECLIRYEPDQFIITPGPRGANFVARAIFDSDFVRINRFSTIMKISVGITASILITTLKQNERLP